MEGKEGPYRRVAESIIGDGRAALREKCRRLRQRLCKTAAKAAITAQSETDVRLGSWPPDLLLR